MTEAQSLPPVIPAISLQLSSPQRIASIPLEQRQPASARSLREGSLRTKRLTKEMRLDPKERLPAGSQWTQQ
eukprot:5892918-Amphidinium_carterae.1